MTGIFGEIILIPWFYWSTKRSFWYNYDCRSHIHLLFIHV